MTTEAVILLILLILAFVLIELRGFGIVHPRWHLGWIGAGLVVLVYIIQVVII